MNRAFPYTYINSYHIMNEQILIHIVSIKCTDCTHIIFKKQALDKEYVIHGLEFVGAYNAKCENNKHTFFL